MFQKHISVKYFKQTNNERQGQKKKKDIVIHAEFII